MDWKKLRQKLVRQKYPDTEELEELREQYEKISEHITEEFGVETFFAGSAGRKTCMKGDRDIDLFLMFPEKLERQELENRGLKIGEKTFRHFDGDYEVDYAEHPYTKGEIDGHEVEIVPCYDTAPGEIKSAVDRSPHHAEWVKENLDQEQIEDVVLLKSFLKAQGIYGSSLMTRGFSGYLCEILIEEYGSFRDLLEEAENWREKTVIDPEEHHEELSGELEEKFSEDSLVVIDPVDEERNVASVLTSENYSKFIHACWKFNQGPGVNFFQREEVEVEKFEVQQEIENRADFIVLEFEAINEPDDIVYPQMRKTLGRLEKRLEKHGFRIFESGFHAGEEEIRMFFELNSSLPGVEYRKGPKVFHGTDHLEEFSSKYENTFIRDERVFSKVDREFTHAKEFLKSFLDGDSDELREKGIPGNVSRKVANFRMMDPMIDDEEWLKFLAEKLKVV